MRIPVTYSCSDTFSFWLIVACTNLIGCFRTCKHFSCFQDLLRFSQSGFPRNVLWTSEGGGWCGSEGRLDRCIPLLAKVRRNYFVLDDGNLHWHTVLLFWRYIYTDSYKGISVANAVDVLAASKKYLTAKLTRYCYGFIQNNITAENSISLWTQV